MLEESPAPPSPPPQQQQVRATAPVRPKSKLHALKALLAINIGMYVLEVFLSGNGPLKPEVLLALGANEASRVWSGEVWRLITSAFLHGGLLHIAVNMQALFMLGAWLEEELGGLRLLVLYLCTALTGSASSVALGTGGLSVGASGAVFGFVGALLSLTFLAPAAQRQVMAATRRQLLFVVLINLGLGFWMNAAGGPMRIDNMAHVGGLVGGLLLGAGLFGAKLHGVRSRFALGGLGLFGAFCGVLLALAVRPAEGPRRLITAAVEAQAKGDTERMRALLLEGARLANEDPDFHVRRYALCELAQDHGCALESLQVLLNMDPHRTGSHVDEHALTSALTLLAAQAYLGGDRTLAVLATRRLAELMPDDAGALNNHAWFLLMRGNLSADEKEEALRAADRARRMARHGFVGGLLGGDLNVEHTWAEALRQAGRLDEALAVLQGMKDMNPVLRQLSGGGRFSIEMIDSEMERMREGKPPRDFD